MQHSTRTAQPVEDVPAEIALGNTREVSQAMRAANARKQSGRRRGIDPTTCERAYTDAELEFFAQVGRWRTQNGGLPTSKTYLDIASALGYRLEEGTLSSVALDAAMRSYRLAARRPFPTICEVLEVMRSLGLEKRAASKA